MQPIAKSKDTDTFKYSGIMIAKNISKLRTLKMKFIRNLLFLVFSTLICGQALAQTATLLPNAKQAFFDQNGNPLSSGTVTFYIPGTTTFKTTWQDANQTILNTNPISLDAAGRAIIYGIGSYRQVVRDRFNNIIWDQVTASTGTSSSGGGGTTNDNNAIGTVLIWAGVTPPTNYVFAYGQELSRTTFPNFLTTITQTLNVTCSTGSPTLTGMTDTSQLPLGAKVESTCAPFGSTIVNKTSNSVTISINSAASVTTTAVFFPYGNGDGSTTFNVPDYRGRVIAGRDNMGGVSANRITSSYYGAVTTAIGAAGGSESQTLTINQMPNHNHTVNDPGHTHTEIGSSGANSGATGPNFSSPIPTSLNTGASTTGITLGATGGGQPHPNVQPSITANYIVKVLNAN